MMLLLLVLLDLVVCGGQSFTYQVLIEPAVDPSSVLATVSTLSGPTSTLHPHGFLDGPPSSARFHHPAGIAARPNGGAYVADASNHAIRRVDGGGVVATIAGGDGPGFADGAGRAARFYNPHGVAVGPDGEIYVADTSNHAVRLVAANGVVTTLFRRKGYAIAEPRQVLAEATAAATSPPPASYTYEESNGKEDGPPQGGGAIAATGDASGLWNPQGIAAWPNPDGSGVRGVLVADTDNHRVLLLSPPATGMGAWSLSLFAGSGSAGFSDGAASFASFSYPRGIALCPVCGPSDRTHQSRAH